MTIKRIQPSSEHTRLIWLETVTTTVARDITEGKNWLPGSLRNQLESTKTSYQALVQESTQLYEARRIAVNNREALVRDLAKHLRLAYRNLIALAATGQLETMQLELYKLPADRRFPIPRTYDGWVNAAKVLVAANTTAVERGLPTITVPTPEVMQAKLDLAVAATQAVADAKARVDDNIAAREAMQGLISTLWRSVGRKLRDQLDDMRPAQIRNNMRRYGFIFQGTPGDEGSGGNTTTGDTTGTTDSGGDSQDNGGENPTTGETTTGTDGSTTGQDDGSSNQGTDAQGQSTPSSTPTTA